METITILLITLALLVALGFAFFQYLYQKEKKIRKDYIFFSLRALSVFLILLILINPQIITNHLEIVKPDLILLTDNSKSVSYLEDDKKLREISESVVENEKIREKFNINRYYFGDQLEEKDSLSFSAAQTDIHAALSETGKIFSNKNNAVILITDGNQNLGRDFRYFKKRSNVEYFPIIVGDTTRFSDLSIDRINVNRYAFLNNRFPVEIFLSSTGWENTEADLNIYSGERKVFSQKVKFSEDLGSAVIRTNLPASSLGVSTYKVELLSPLQEKNMVNNHQKFAIEVVDERTSVLILSDIPHPDLGAIEKAVESNQQRTADIKYLNDKNLQLSEFQLIIIYQVNRKFNAVISEIIDNKYSYLLITGTKTDWNYLNQLELGYSKNTTNQTQEIFPVYNPVFSSFQFEDLGFDDFPPLVDKFGTLEFERNKFNIMLYQELEGVKTGDPMLFISQNSPKFGVLLGENIWRWRAKSFLDYISFDVFDEFFGKIIQNLASKSSRQRLALEAENFYYGNQNIIISAQYFDENYQFDAGANLKITVTNLETEESFTSDFILKNNYYQFDGGALNPGSYSYEVIVPGKNLSKSGEFEVIEYDAERQVASANLSGMQSFAQNTGSELFFPDQPDELINTLLKEDKFKPIQKSRQKAVPLIDWFYLLFILIFVLAAEWFYRKYLGLI